MGFVLAALWWLTALGLTSLAAFVAVGDRLLSVAAHRFASDYVGDKFALRWSLAAGVFELHGLSLGRALLTVLEPFTGVPMDLEFVRLELFRFELPWPLLLSRSDRPFESTIEIGGFQLGLIVNEPEKWLAMREENLARFQQAIQDAAVARVAKANAWTVAVIQKLKDLAAARAAVAAPKKSDPPTGSTPSWQKHVDRVIDSFAIVVSRMAVTIRDEHADSGIGIALERFEIGRASPESEAPATRRQRVVRVVEFALFVNPSLRVDKSSFVIPPVSLNIRVATPLVLQSLLYAAIPEKRSLELTLAFPSDVVVQLRPVQLSKLLQVLRPLNFYTDWYARALAMDEGSCVEIVGADADEYMTLYRQQHAFETTTGLVTKLLAGLRQKDELAARTTRLDAIEKKTLASRLLYLRSVALDWDVPSGGAALPHTSGTLKRRKDLRTFLASPLAKYVPQLETPPMFHAVALSLSLRSVEMQLLDNTDSELLTLFAHDLSLGMEYMMEQVPDDALALELDFKIQRFGMLDERNVPSNVFRRLLDQNPGAEHLLALHLTQTGGGHIGVDVALADFTLLVVFDPLLHVTKVFLPALEEDEATELRYLSYASLQTPPSPEQQEETVPVYKSEVPTEYSPLLLQGLSLRGNIAMNHCEICLLGDSASLRSHVLAFTTDLTIKIVSSARHEAVEMQLEDVALQPCRIVILDDAIDLEIRAGVRTILELEGEGVDLLLGYKLVVGDTKAPLSSTFLMKDDEAAAPKKTGAALWNVARAAVVSNQIVEVDHDEVLKKADEKSLASSRSGRSDRLKPGARRRIVVKMSDFAMNMSANDLGVLLSISAALDAAMKEDVAVVRAREARQQRLEAARKQLQEQQFMERLKREFQTRDVDGGDTLDADEIASLIRSVANCDKLTTDEFDATVREFLLIVDRDGSGDVSFDEFESVLSRKKLVYHRLHHGVVSLTGHEYVDPSRPRSSVPPLRPHSSSMADVGELARFWDKYVHQVGTTRTSLNGLTPMIVQKKMVRTFKNYEYAQEAWLRLVNPSLAKPAEKAPWLLTKEMDMGSRGNVIDQLLSSFDREQEVPPTLASTASGSQRPALDMFIQTVLSTSFGGFYIRLIDENMATRDPSIELSVEEVVVYANGSAWEGEGVTPTPTSDAELETRKRAKKNDFGVAKLSFAIYGKYYNPKAKHVEPFLEYFPGSLDIRKDPEAHTEIMFTSDRYFQLNVTHAFMDVVKINMATFSRVEARADKDRAHIKEEGGLFWLVNETGTSVTYSVVAKKQNKDRIHVETVSAVATVPPNEAHACLPLDGDELTEEMNQQALKEKQLRQAFREADADGSGELDTKEVREVLVKVYEEEYRNRKHDRVFGTNSLSRQSSSTSSLFTRSESVFSNDAELDKLVEDFIALADTDGSGQVSLEEFKIAISKMREKVDRFLTLEIEGFDAIHNIPVSAIGHTQVYELTPFFDDVESEKSIAYLYQEGVALLTTSETPTHHELQRAFACFRRVREMDPHYEWIDSYYGECVKKYLPVLVAVHVSVDGVYGLQVKVTGATFIRNDTAKATECLLVDEHRVISRDNPLQLKTASGSKERFFVLPPRGAIPIPLDLIGRGFFAIRQTGETDWSNFLPLSVREQRLFKSLTRFEQREAKRALREDSTRLSLSSSRMVSEKMGKNVALPNPSEYVAPGKEVVYPSTSIIDNQPTQVVEKIAFNDSQLGTWSIVIQPQLVLQNVLPCALEYAIVQAGDCPADMLDANGDFRVARSDKNKTPHAIAMLGRIDYFQYVDHVNGRHLVVESGKSVQVFGLDLDKPALMRVRLCADTETRGAHWSPAFLLQLNAKREAFNNELFEVRFGNEKDDGPVVVVHQQWTPNAARTLNVFAPYWIQNRSGLDFRFRLPKGGVLGSVDAHRAYFHGGREIPILANAPPTKALLIVRPYQETPRVYESTFLLSQTTKKYLPNFDKVDWSEPQDMASVGTKGELAASDRSFVVAFEILAAPGQFFRSKIVRLSPRFIVVNKVPRPLQVTPLTLDKKLRPSTVRGDATSANVGLQPGEALVAYRFAGNEKHHMGLRLRDTFRDEALHEVGAWTPAVPIKAGDDYSVWTRGSLGDGPACNIAFQNMEETITAVIDDVSLTPRYRIENRSTRHAFRYVQHGVKDAEEVIIKPLESHSFVWDNPLTDDRKLKVTPLNWKIPTLIDIRHIGPRSMLTSDGLYSEVYIDGSTRVFAVGDAPTYSADRTRAELHDWLSSTLIDCALHGFGLTIVDAHPQEVLNLTLENLKLASSVGSRQVVFSLHHMQIDDMTPHALYPVVLAPLDSGFNSDKREGWLPHDGERPFFTVSLATSASSTTSSITIVDDFELGVHSMAMKLNLEYMLGLVNLLSEFVPTSDDDAIVQQGVDYNKSLLTLELSVPEHATLGGMLFYFKKWRMTPYEFHLVFDSSAEDRGEGISSILGSTVGSIVGGIAHVTPEFDFDEILYENRFFYEYDLMNAVVWNIVYAVLGQWYKIVGSVELLGDPVGLATDIVDGFALAARQLKRDLRGKSMRKGESALTIAQTVVGAPMRSIGKVSNGLGDLVKKATDFESQEEAEQPRHVPEGLLHGGVVFGKSLVHGVKGFVKEPVRGAKQDGFKGFAKGVGRGTLQLVASPVVGTLGVVEKLSMSVSNTTHLLDQKGFEGTRRPARDLGGSSALKDLAESNVITEVELHVLYAEGLPDKASPQAVVRVYHQAPGEPAHDVFKFKSSTLHHTGTPKFDQSWLIPVTSLDTHVEIHLFHKRKPVPKKSLGFVRLSMEDIYRDFGGVPAKLLADTKAKLRLRRRKRVSGSILNELATSSASPVLEARDETWRKAVSSKPSSTKDFMSDELDDDMDDSDDAFALEAELLSSSKSITIDQSLEIHPVGLPLMGAASSDAKVFVSIRYVNDMRRYG